MAHTLSRPPIPPPPLTITTPSLAHTPPTHLIQRLNGSTQRLSNDVDRAVQNLETRVRRLLAVVAGGVGEATEGSSVASSPGPTSPESPAIGAGKGGAKTVGVEGSISRQERKSLEGSAAPHPPAQQSMESDTETYSV